MALILLGNGITDARGSVGGTSYSRSKSGAINLRRPHGVNPRSHTQTTARSNFAQLAGFWSGTMADVDRHAWNAFAAANPTTNRFGNVVYLSGFGAFCSCNGVITHIGGTPSAVPPSLPFTGVMNTLSVTAVHGATPTITLTIGYVGGGGVPQLQVYASPPLSPGIGFVSSQMRYVNTFTPGSPLSIGSAYKAAFGYTIAAAGPRIFVRCRVMDQNTGLHTPSIQATCLVT